MAKRRRTGRPKGSTNVERVEVLHRPACCPKCGSTKIDIGAKLDGGLGECASPGWWQGQKYTHVECRHGKCLECGQYLRIRTFAYDGERLVKPVGIDADTNTAPPPP